MDEMKSDKRFSHITSDPRFRKMPQKQRKMKIDHRFKSMFHDKRFKLKYSVDKRGKPVDLTTNENLRRYYELSDSEDQESDSESDEVSSEEDVCEDQKVHKNDSSSSEGKQKLPKNNESVKCIKSAEKEKKRLNAEHLKNSPQNSDIVEKKKGNEFNKKKRKEIVSDSEDSSNSENSDSVDTGLEDESEASGSELSDRGSGPDLARGEGLQETSEEDTDSDFSEDDTVEHDQTVDHKWGELDKDAPEATELGKRLALCNMDWDRIKALDLFVLFQSFIKSGGSVLSVKIYPSEYGQKRMEAEAVKGPTEFLNENPDSVNDLVEDDEGNTYSKEKLRQYQINRLKYYYAVIEFDSIGTASHVYDECDGLEYETSSARLDLRFIPEDMTFDQDAKDTCTDMPDRSLYKPSIFFTTALCQFKVDLTWDETDHERIQLTTKKFTKDDVKEDNFKAFLASSSDEEASYTNKLHALKESDDFSDNDDDEKRIEKYRSLIQEIQSEEDKKAKDVEMEISWEPGLKETAEKLVKKKKKTEDNTPWEDYLQKRRDKKIEKREAKKAKEHKPEVQHEDRENADVAFSDDELPDGVDPADPFFRHEEENDEVQVKTDSKKKKKLKKKKEKLSESELKVQKKEEAELDLLLLDENDNRKHFSLKELIDDDSTKKKKKKKMKKWKEEKKKTDDDFKMNLEDPRFEAMYTSHLYSVDPSAPEFKNTKGMKAIIDEKIKRRQKQSDDNHKHFSKRRKHDDVVLNQEIKRDTSNDSKTVKDASLSMLVKSVKAKTEKHKMNRKK